MSEMRTNDFDIENGVLKYYKGSDEDVVIPEGVTAIGDKAFYYKSGIKSVLIPEGVTSIGKSAFYSCSELRSVKIPMSVISIGRDAFYTEEKIEFDIPEEASNDAKNYDVVKNVLVKYNGPGGKVIIPAGVMTIGEYAFYHCSTLTSVTIPESVASIGKGAFSYCCNLTKVNIPKGVTSIENYTFAFCQNIPELIIPNGVKTIGEQAFYGCRNLKDVTIPSTVTNIKNSAFSGCRSFKNIVIPNSVTNIGNNAFEDFWDKNLSFESGYLCRPIKLPALSASEIVDPISCAYAMLYQSGKVWDTAIEEYIQRNSGQFNNILKEVIKIIAEDSKETVAKKAIHASLHYIDLSDADVFKQLYAILFEKKLKCLKMLIEDVRAQEILLDGRLTPEGIETEEKTEHPVEKIVNENWKASETTRKLQMIITKGIPYADSGELSSPEAVIMVISSYADQIDDSINYYSLYQTSYVHTQPDAIADQIAASLDKEKLQELLDKCAHGQTGGSIVQWDGKTLLSEEVH